MARVFDLVMTHQLDADDLFIHRVQWHCADQRLGFFLIEPLWVDLFYRRYEEGQVWARTLLNMHSEHHLPQEIYHRLVLLAHERGTQVIDPPAIARSAFDKAQLHPRLAAAGLTVPPTLIVSAAQWSSFRLSDEDRRLLAPPFVIKPALGYGKRGIILDATGEADLARSAAAWPEGDYLLQRRITARTIDGEPAYFRVFYAFGTIWCCWWNCYTDRYRILSPEDEIRLKLSPLRDIVARVAGLTGMRFFSSEIALTESGEFMLIDYVNDQCHMLSQTADPRIGVPDPVVTAIAQRLVEGAAALIRQSDPA